MRSRLKIGMPGSARPSMWAFALAIFVCGIGGAAEKGYADSGRVMLVELFTSQSCSSCPPADVIMGEISKREDVLALSYHVDYWDHLGWKDTYSSPANTRRQHNYASANGFQVYTPQLVVDGSRDAVGSDRRAVMKVLDAVEPSIVHAPVRLARTPGGKLDIVIGRMQAGPASARGAITLLSFDEKSEVPVRSGENAGRRLTYYNIVRSSRTVGNWNNQAMHLEESLSADEMGRGLAVIVQDTTGAVWAVSAPLRKI